MNLDPYAILGVERDATQADVKKAYRRKSKAAHPDVGGKPEAWSALCTAVAVLSDPVRRQTYDETGRIEEPLPDNQRAVALQLIQQNMQAILNEFLQTWHPSLDPRTKDIVGIIAVRLRAEIDQMKETARGGRKVVGFFEDMEKRFKRKKNDGQPNVLARSLRQQIESNEQQLAILQRQIESREMAIKIVKEHSFTSDTYAPGGGTMFINLGASTI